MDREVEARSSGNKVNASENIVIPHGNNEKKTGKPCDGLNLHPPGNFLFHAGVDVIVLETH